MYEVQLYNYCGEHLVCVLLGRRNRTVHADSYYHDEHKQTLTARFKLNVSLGDFFLIVLGADILPTLYKDLTNPFKLDCKELTEKLPLDIDLYWLLRRERPGLQAMLNEAESKINDLCSRVYAGIDIRLRPIISSYAGNVEPEDFKSICAANLNSGNLRKYGYNKNSINVYIVKPGLPYQITRVNRYGWADGNAILLDCRASVSLIVHELGHCLGLKHLTDKYSINPCLDIFTWSKGGNENVMDDQLEQRNAITTGQVIHAHYANGSWFEESKKYVYKSKLSVFECTYLPELFYDIPDKSCPVKPIDWPELYPDAQGEDVISEISNKVDCGTH